MDVGGRLLTCGKNLGHGLLGQGEGVEESLVPRPVVGLGGVCIRTVAAGMYHTLACSDEGVAFSFGNGDVGRLGHGDTLGQPTPRVIEALQGVHISAMTTGLDHSLVLSDTGTLYSYGDGAHGQLGHGDTVSTPSATAASDCSATATGRTS